MGGVGAQSSPRRRPISSLVHELVVPTGEFALDPPRRVELKGIDVTQLVYPLAAAR